MSKIKELFKRSDLVDKPLSRLKYWSKQFKGSLTLLCLLGLFSFPLLTQNPYYLGIFINAAIFSVFAASWNFLAGFTGQVSFGHAIFLGMGGYFTAALIRYLNFPWFVSLLIGGVVALGMALVIGIICLRLRGPYLALATMALGVFLMSLFNNEILGDATDWLFFGSQGIDRVPPISSNSVVVFYTYLIIMLVSVIIMILIGRSNFGTVLKSIRDDDTGAEASGINITKYKVIAFMISGFFAGMAGGLFSMHTRNVAPAFFQPLYSFYAIIMTTIGGLGLISGSVLGAFVFFGLEWLLSDLWDPVFLFSIILIIIIRFAEEGLLRPALEHLKDLWDLLIGK